MNYVEELFLKYPNMDKRMVSCLSIQGNISGEFVMNNLHINWNMIVFNCSKFPIDFILSHLEMNWNMVSLTKHPKVTLEIIETHPEIEWRYECLHRNPNFEFSWIEKHPRWYWNMKDITYENVTEELVEKYPNFEWDIIELTEHSNISIEFVLRHPEIKWTGALRYKEGVTRELIRNHPEFNWPSFCLKYRDGENIRTILQDAKLTEYYEDSLHERDDFSLDLLEIYPNVKWNYEKIFYKFKLPIEFAKKYVNPNWHVERLLEHKGCTIEFLIEHPELKYDYRNDVSSYIKDKLQEKEKRKQEWSVFAQSCMLSAKHNSSNVLAQFVNHDLFDINLLKCIKQNLL